MLVGEATVYALGRVALLVVNAPVLLEHLGDQRLVGVEDALLGPLDRPLRREVLLGEVLSDGGAGEPGGLVGLGRGAALRGQVPDLHLLRHAQQVLPAFLWVSGTLPGRGWHKRWQGYWHAW